MTVPEANPLNSHAGKQTDWRREARWCAEDRMFGCAAFALTQYLAAHPDQDTPAQRQQIETWRELGDVAVHDTAQERVARALESGRTRRLRRFNALLGRAEKGTLTDVEESELGALAHVLDDAPVSPQGAL